MPNGAADASGLELRHLAARRAGRRYGAVEVANLPAAPRYRSCSAADTMPRCLLKPGDPPGTLPLVRSPDDNGYERFARA
jgi:hypothetical protein